MGCLPICDLGFLCKPIRGHQNIHTIVGCRALGRTTHVCRQVPAPPPGRVLSLAPIFGGPSPLCQPKHFQQPRQIASILKRTLASAAPQELGCARLVNMLSAAGGPLPPTLHACVCGGLLQISNRLQGVLLQRRAAATTAPEGGAARTVAEAGSAYAAQQRMVNCTINGHAISVPEGSSILSAARQLDIHVSAATATALQCTILVLREEQLPNTIPLPTCSPPCRSPRCAPTPAYPPPPAPAGCAWWRRGAAAS